MDDQFLDMNDEDIDNLLFGINISDIKQVNDNMCISCKSGNMAIDETQGYNVCMDCGVVNNTYLNIGSKFDTLINSYNTINKYRDIIGEFITAIKICYDKLKKKKKAPEYYSFDDISRNILPSENKKFMSIFYSWIQRKNTDIEFKLFFSDEFLDMITTLSTMNKIDVERTLSMWNDFKPNYKIYKNLFTKMYSYIKTLEPKSEPYYKKIKSYVENENEEIVVYETVFIELSSKLKTITELSKNIIKYFGETYSDNGNIDDIVLNTILLICKQYSIEMNKEQQKNYKEKRLQQKQKRLQEILQLQFLQLD